MKQVIAFFLLLAFTKADAQLEVSTGFAVNRNLAAGAPIQLGYDFKLKNRFFTKSQVGYKHLSHYNDFVGATLRVNIFELHQTVAYEVIKKRKYILKPNIGINYRFYHWKGEMVPPLNTQPQRAWVIGVRDKNFILSSYGDGYLKEYRVNNLGFSIQVQNQFKLTDKVWLHATPFLEPDYDRSQNTGGCYIGIILKDL